MMCWLAAIGLHCLQSGSCRYWLHGAGRPSPLCLPGCEQGSPKLGVAPISRDSALT